MTSCICCMWPAHQLHHVVYQQEIRRRGGDTSDPRSMVPVSLRCHEQHHSRFKPLPLSALPDDAYDFAHELLGAFAYDYLKRRYAGDDPRLDALLEREAA